MNEDSKHSVLIYTGRSIIAQGLIFRLSEIGINPIEKNDMESAVRSGFAVGDNAQARIFIRKDELERARKVINDYLEEVGEEE